MCYKKAMSLGSTFLDELRNRISLSEVIGRRVKVTRAGREYKACCPFHHEKTPSFTINDDKQFYHCFGCGVHGDVIKFVMEHDNLGFMDAVEILAAEAGMQVPKQTPQEAAQARQAKDLYSLLEDTTLFFEKYLQEPRNKDVMTYLLDRGITEKAIKDFRVGFAPDDNQALRKFLLSKEYTDKDMITAGVLKASTRGGDPYVFFRDRVMFPVPDRRGRIVAFGGRILPEHMRPPQRGDFKPPKYINSTETPLFHKGRMLYGEPTARRAAADGRQIVLVEGYMDVIACAQAGVGGALAPMGTAVTEEQIIAMWKMIPDFNKVPILCFDGDNAGRKAAWRVCERLLPLLEPGRSVRFAFMPDGEDPDSLIKSHGVKGFKEVMSRTLSLFDFIWTSYTQSQKIETPDEKVSVKKQLENEVARIAHRDVQESYRAELSNRISKVFYPPRNFSRNQSRNQNFTPNRNWSGGGRNKPVASGMMLKPKSPRAKGKSLFPKVLLAGIINYPQIFEAVEEIISGVSFKIPRLEQIRQNIIGFLCENPDSDRSELLAHLGAQGFSQEIDDICSESVYVHASFCSPSANEENIQSNWLEYWNDCNSAGLEEEIQKGWKRAYFDSNEKEEEKLRSLLSMKANEEN